MDINTQIFTVIAVMVSLVVIWMLLGHYIVNTAVLVATALIYASKFVYDLLPSSEYTDLVYFFFVDEMFIKETDDVVGKISKYNSLTPTLGDAKNVFYIIGYFLRVPIALLAIWATYLCYCQSRPSQLKRRFDIFSLSRYSQAEFPQIRPPIMANLISTSFDEGAYRQEVGPIRFAILNNALTYICEEGQEYTVKFGKSLKMNSKKGIITIIDSYDEDEGLPVIHARCKLNAPKIRNVIRNQITHLGRWESPNELSPQIRALYAIFLLMIKGGKKNKEKAFSMLDHFSATFRGNKELSATNMFDDKGVDEVIERLGNQVAVKKIHKQFTYTITVLCALYYRATHRRSKLPPSRFIWLKEVDIKTWYALHHNLSTAAWTEAAGPRGIWLTELKLNKKANYPFTDNALLGYLKYLNAEGWLIEQPSNITEVSI